ncbi:lysoplasmalogenase [Chryseobacterium suipulveris]|uniref:Lysoplasmalogenase n=1 Tax=Chryseobacterium suipulveris TaxID=2929800 RepID=A0ABY4BSX2_9FLAO|nr:lysoplasmalogenase [Chryseobacterium suipulveris]UOE40783.1 lysoplasmalogenase [Chryseobacterium suipulveris]
MKTKILKIILFIVFLADLFFVFKNQTEPRFFTKTLLIPLLILIYVFESNSRKNLLNKTFVIGLIFSFFGDFFLLFKWGFLAGLGSFLLAHVLYIFCFLKLSVRKHLPFLAVALSLYASGLIFYLFPYLNEMKIPVIIYGLVISTMLYFAVLTSNKNLIFGAVLFVISDSVLSINLFVKETVVLSLLVMITYISAQWFLVKGMISNPKKL